MGKRVLVVDDEPVIRDLLWRILSDHGYLVDLASSGEAGLQKIASSEYDVYLLDMKMPCVDGKDMYQTISAAYPAVASRVIFVTGDTISATTLEFLRSTGRAYFGKPLDFAALVNAMNAATLPDAI